MPELRLEVVTDDSGFSALRAEWSALVASAPDASVFLTYEWAHAWWKHFRGGSRLHLLAVRDGEGLCAVAPFLETGRAVGPVGVRLLVGLGQENADYGGVLVAEGRKDAVDLILHHLWEEMAGSPTVVNLTRVTRGSVLDRALDDFARDPAHDVTRMEHSSYPQLVFALCDDPAGYVAKRDTRNDSRRALKRLREAHEVIFEYDCGFDDAALGAVFDLYDRRWAALAGSPTGLFATAAGRAFLADVGATLHAQGIARISVLRSDGAPIAIRFGFESGGAYLGYMEAFDPDYGKFGPGQILVARILEAALERGLERFDFMRGEGFHKSKWANTERDVDYVLLSRSGRRGVADRWLAWNVMRLRRRRQR